MIAKVLILSCACVAAVAGIGAPLVYGGLSHGLGVPGIAAHGLGVSYGAPAIAAHAYAAPAYAAPVIAKQLVQAETIDPNPAYSFSYGVSDPSTGDQKNAAETLQNGVVHGSYSLVEPDGHLRKVTYTADNVNGFNAVVERTGGAHAVAGPVLAHGPVAVAAPVAKLTLPGIGHPWG